MLTNVFSNLGSGAFAVAIFGALVFGVFAVGMVFAQALFTAIPALEPWIFRRLNLTPYKGAQPVATISHSYEIGARLEQIAPPVRLEAHAVATAVRREADSFLKTIHHAQRVERINKERAIRGRRIRSDGSRLLLDNGAVVFREARPCASCGRQRKIFVLPELSLELNARTATASEPARCLSCSRKTKRRGE